MTKIKILMDSTCDLPASYFRDKDGMLLPSGRVRSRQASLAQLLDLTKEAAGDTPVRFAVIHGEARAEAEQVLAAGKKMLHYTDTFIDDVAISLAVHFGTGVIGTVVYPDFAKE